MSIGPVQSWIAAGRRTRDFWAGSFLLSWMSGHAMAEVKRAEGDITIPAVQADGEVIEPTLQAILRGRSEEPRPGPLVGTLVNHFRAEVRAEFDPNIAVSAARGAFKHLADIVWDYFFEEAAKKYEWDESVKQRWDFQCSGSFFEFLWVQGQAEHGWAEEARWLERRKTLRLSAPPDETAIGLPGKGDPCPVHGELRELGGFFRANQREAQDEFWEEVREAVARGVYGEVTGKYIETLEVRQGERLSALALVKRLFPLLPPGRLQTAIGWIPDHLHATPNVGDAERVWDAAAAQRALRNWPSTAFVAAIPWIVEVGSSHADHADTYADNQYRLLNVDRKKWRAELPQRHRIAGIDALGHDGTIPLFAVLDGTLHFARGLEAHRFGGDETTAKELQESFERLIKDVQPIGPPASFYAMLEMDGDSMGSWFSHSKARAEATSTALLKFADGVPEIVRNHDGVLIYAGADDVNAMLPTATAVDCARAIREHWVSTMRSLACDDRAPPSLSGSILFCDYQNALDDMRRLTHSRLDEVAKDAMGRNALALAVVKSGGITAEWASRWEDLGGKHKPEEIVAFAAAATEEKTLASRLAYVLRDRFSAILENEEFDDELLRKLLVKELGDSGLAAQGDEPAKKAEAVARLLRPAGTSAAVPGLALPAPRHVGALLVARFLSGNLAWSYRKKWIGSPRPQAETP